MESNGLLCFVYVSIYFAVNLWSSVICFALMLGSLE